MNAPVCLYCNDTGVLCRIETAKGEFVTYCDKCDVAWTSATATQPPIAPLPVAPPTSDIIRE